MAIETQTTERNEKERNWEAPKTGFNDPEFVRRMVELSESLRGSDQKISTDSKTEAPTETPDQKYARKKIDEYYPISENINSNSQKYHQERKNQIIENTLHLLDKYKVGETDDGYLDEIIGLAAERINAQEDPRTFFAGQEKGASSQVKTQEEINKNEQEYITNAYRNMLRRKGILPPEKSDTAQKVEEKIESGIKENAASKETDSIKVQVGQKWGFRPEAGLEGIRTVLEIDEINDVVVLSSTEIEQKRFEELKKRTGDVGSAAPHKTYPLSFLVKYGVKK